MRVEELKHAAVQLPFASSELPGTGGLLKSTPDTFQVDEILSEDPAGSGEHVYVRIRKRGITTQEVAKTLANAFDIPMRDIGWAGLKDKQGVTTQTFSVWQPASVTQAEIETRLQACRPCEILDIRRHRQKLRMGQISENRFRITLTGVEPESKARAQAIVDRLRREGLPNYYGNQRFGNEHSGIDRAFDILHGREIHQPRTRYFVVATLQAALFNLWLTERNRRHQLRTVLAGDVMRDEAARDFFLAGDPDALRPAVAVGAISLTGPMFGFEMLQPTGAPLRHELELQARFKLGEQQWRTLRAVGTRRNALLRLDSLQVSTVPAGLEFSFALPSGAYATVVMREFTRQDGDSDAETDDE